MHGRERETTTAGGLAGNSSILGVIATSWNNPVIGGASKTVPIPDKWGGKPENPA